MENRNDPKESDYPKNERPEFWGRHDQTEDSFNPIPTATNDPELIKQGVPELTPAESANEVKAVEVEPLEACSGDVEEAARIFCNITHGRFLDSEERYYKDYQKYDGFIAGAQWQASQQSKSLNEAVEWINVKDKTPLCYIRGEWDGKRSDEIIVEDKDGTKFLATVYEGTMDGSHFIDWISDSDYTIEFPVKWMKIPL